MERFTNLRVILAQGPCANLLCIIPILVYVLPKRAPFFYFLIEAQLIYSIVLVSGVQQWFSYVYIYIYIHILFHILFHYNYKTLNIILLLHIRTLLFPLFIYSSLYLLIPNSQYIPPYPLSLQFPFGNPSVSLFSMSGSLFLFYKYVLLYHILDSTYKWYHIIFVFLWLTQFDNV